MKNKAMNVLLTTTMILGSATALAGSTGSYQDKSASNYHTSPDHVNSNRSQNESMNKPMRSYDDVNTTASSTERWSKKSQDKKMLEARTSMNDVKRVQEALNQKGFAAGTTDGIIGAKTRAAITKFQKENNLAATGSLNQQTLEKMNIERNFKPEASDTYAE